MIIIESNLPFLTCGTCNKDYKLMKFIESIKPNNVNCPICKFETISFKKDNFDITICPFC